ncbi:hypothetical protein IKI14_05470 [bacterium]|nr:hypothetical protein [bacterium]
MIKDFFNPLKIPSISAPSTINENTSKPDQINTNNINTIIDNFAKKYHL